MEQLSVAFDESFLHGQTGIQGVNGRGGRGGAEGLMYVLGTASSWSISGKTSFTVACLLFFFPALWLLFLPSSQCSPCPGFSGAKRAHTSKQWHAALHWHTLRKTDTERTKHNHKVVKASLSHQDHSQSVLLSDHSTILQNRENYLFLEDFGEIFRNCVHRQYFFREIKFSSYLRSNCQIWRCQQGEMFVHEVWFFFPVCSRVLTENFKIFPFNHEDTLYFPMLLKFNNLV